MIGLNVRAAFLRVAVTAGTSVHTIFGENIEWLNVLVERSPYFRLVFVAYAAVWVYVILSDMAPILALRHKVVNEAAIVALSHIDQKIGG